MDLLAHTPPRQIALVDDQRSYTYAALSDWADRLVDRLRRAGAQAGDVIGVAFGARGNLAAHIALIHALARGEMVMTPLNARLHAHERLQQAYEADCRFLVDEDWLEDDARAPLSLPVREDFDRAALRGAQGIFFTSGTTGKPKGALISLEAHLASAHMSAERLGAFPTDRWLLNLPMYHVGGLAIVFRTALAGATIVLHPHFDAARLDAAVANQGISLISLVPTTLHRWLKQTPQPRAPHLRAVLLGGAAAPLALLQRAWQAQLPIAPTYGLTEAASQVATAQPDEARCAPGSVGKPLPGNTVWIADEDGSPLPPGAIGEIVVRGPTLMRGYYRQPDATQRALRNGALHTGDFGYLDAQGHLWVVNRREDLIVSGGENVYPAEVEAALHAHPAVQEACVFGLDDPEWGQRVAAAVILQPGVMTSAQALIAFVRERLAGYKAPRHIFFLDELPRNAMGKVQRAQLRALFTPPPHQP